MLRRLTALEDPRLLVGVATGDDAGVYQIDRKRALVFTVDFFTPIVDDAFLYGQIAAANALSDVYAMGGRPLIALNIVGMPTDVVPPEVVDTVLRGGAALVKRAGCILAGGHSIKNPEPIYGLAVTGLVHPRRLITNADAHPGDVLVLTKPLGTGIVTTALKRGLARPALARRVVRSMCTLNTPGADLAERCWVRAGTDVTGFGLLGHLLALCRASHVGAEIDSHLVPTFDREVLHLIKAKCIPGGTRQNLEAANDATEWDNVPETMRVLLADAQTSGGLLLCVPPRRLAAVLQLLHDCRTRCAAVIGRIVRSSRPRIQVHHSVAPKAEG